MRPRLGVHGCSDAKIDSRLCVAAVAVLSRCLEIMKCKREMQTGIPEMMGGEGWSTEQSIAAAVMDGWMDG